MSYSVHQTMKGAGLDFINNSVQVIIAKNNGPGTKSKTPKFTIVMLYIGVYLNPSDVTRKVVLLMGL